MIHQTKVDIIGFARRALLAASFAGVASVVMPVSEAGADTLNIGFIFGGDLTYDYFINTIAEDATKFGPGGVVDVDFNFTLEPAAGTFSDYDVIFSSALNQASSVRNELTAFWEAGGHVVNFGEVESFIGFAVDNLGLGIGQQCCSINAAFPTGNGENRLDADGPFGSEPDGTVTFSAGNTLSGDFSLGTIALDDGSGNATAAYWEADILGAGTGAVIVLADSNILTDDSNVIQDNVTFASNLLAFLAEEEFGGAVIPTPGGLGLMAVALLAARVARRC